MKKILISACLAGDLVRYDGKQKRIQDKVFNIWLQQGRLVKICPEVSGGLNIPRPPAQIMGGKGLDVIRGKASVQTIDGEDVTRAFLKGAECALSIAQENNIHIAILKEKSPSCGSSLIYDGSFTEVKVPGDGVTTALLRENGIEVFSEHQMKLVESIINGLEEY